MPLPVLFRSKLERKARSRNISSAAGSCLQATANADAFCTEQIFFGGAVHELWPVTSNTEEHFEVILFLFASFQTVPKSHHNFFLHEISYGYFRRVKYLGVTHSRNFSGFLSPPRKRFPEATCSDLQATSGAEMYPSDFHDLRYDLYKMLRFTGPPRCPLGTRSWEVQRTASHRTALFFPSGLMKQKQKM